MNLDSKTYDGMALCEACVDKGANVTRSAGEDRCGRCGTYGRVWREKPNGSI